jgi:tetratricopeptide (TPR) repeat protein
MRPPPRGAEACAFAAALLLVLAGNRWVAPAAGAGRACTTLDQELAFYPSGRLLRQVSGGFQSAVADLLWLRAIQYYGEHRKTDLSFDKAAHVFRVITDLDPHFVDAYRFGALVVIGDARDPEGGYALLRKGIRANPGSWELAFDLGFHHFLHEEYDRAAWYFRRAALLRPGDDRAARFAAYAEKKRGGIDTSEEMWKEILETTENDRFREAARFALLGIQVSRDTTVLAHSARAFRDRYGRFPRNTGEMARAGLLDRVPEEPFGERYVIQPKTGEVRSSYLLGREMRRDLGVLQRAADRFRAEYGRVPDDPDELTATGLLVEVPSPWGVRYSIDRASGEVRAGLGGGTGLPGAVLPSKGGSGS